jgi:aryl-alcohol dehydrogenase-like predicted oxidoreductase
MRYRTLGQRTQLQVSEIGLGAWGIGGPVAVRNRTGPDLMPANYGHVSEEDAIATIHAALELGITFIDTAPFYGGDGVSESRIGRALRGRPENVVVATKVGVFKEGDEYRRVFTREVVRRQVEESRRRLDRDVLDVELIHSPSRAEYGGGESLEELVAQKAAGRVRFIGFSIGQIPAPGEQSQLGTAPPDSGDAVIQQALGFLRTGVVDVLEVPLSLLRPQAADQLVQAAGRLGVGVIAREPLANGFLTGRFTRDTEFPADDQRRNWPRQQVADFVERAERFRFLAEGAARTPSQAALAWVLSHPEVSTVIGGAMRPGEITENAATSDLPALSEAERERVREIHARDLAGTGR